MYQYLFRRAFLVDGTGADGRFADVAVKDGKVVKISASIDQEAERVIDVNGHILCPGFIDVHSHSDISLLYENNPVSKLYQGIVTEVVGNCGFSPFPLKTEPEWIKQRRNSLSFIDVEAVEWNWDTYEGYRERMNNVPPNVNVVSLVGHGNLRAVAMGYDNKKAAPEQLQCMCGMLEEHLQQGVAGLSTGLGYPPDFYGDEEELTELARVVRKYDRVFTFHIRGERATLFKAVKEVISIGKNSGARVHISHLKCAGIHNVGRSGELLELIDTAMSQGVDISFDMYPYTAGSSNLGLLFPPASHEGGTAALIKRLDIDAERKKIIVQMEQGTEGWSTLIGEQQGKNLMITSVGLHKEWTGRRISEMAEEWDCTAAEAACRMMTEESGKIEMVMFLSENADVNRIAMHPGCFYGTDGLAMGGDQERIRQLPHPRYYGSFPSLINRYSGDGGLSFEQLIYKMTGAAARRFGITTRGEIREGFCADMIIFDPSLFKANATYENPCQPSEGIEYLMVNGCMEIDDREVTGKRGGEVIRSSGLK